MKKIDKIYWYCVGAIWLVILLNSCKSTKPGCDSYGFVQPPNQIKNHELIIVTNDTLHLEEEHIHLDEKQACEWSPSEIYIINDTFRIQY